MAEQNPSVTEQLQSGSAALARAYVAAWAEVGVDVEKDANNPHFGNDYATLKATLKKLKPIFAKHKLAILQTPGKIEGDKISITTMLVHESGQVLAFESQMPMGGKSTAQAGGSATTYAKRYVLKSIGGLADSDDDGEEASAPASKSTPRKSRAAAKDADDGDQMEDARKDYAARAEALIETINGFEGTYDELEKQVRPQVEEMGDEKINKVYVEKRRALKGKK